MFCPHSLDAIKHTFSSMPAFNHDCVQLHKPRILKASRDFSPQYLWNSKAYGLPDAMLRLTPRKTSSDDADRYRISTASLWTCLYLSGCISSGCAFFPEQISDDPEPGNCLVSTPEWKLTLLLTRHYQLKGIPLFRSKCLEDVMPAGKLVGQYLFLQFEKLVLFTHQLRFRGLRVQ